MLGIRFCFKEALRACSEDRPTPRRIPYKSLYELPIDAYGID